MALTRPKYSQIYDTDWKQSVEAGTIGSDIGNLIVGNTQPSILDGFSLSIGNRILVKDQTDGTQNGLYRVANVGSGSNGWWVRTLDANQSGFVTSGLTVVVDAGTINGGREFRLITQDPITLGSTSLTFISQTGNPGGANTQVQFYDSISGIPQLSGNPGFTYNKTSNAVVMSGTLFSSNHTISASNASVSLSDTNSGNTTTIVGNTAGNYTVTLPGVSGALAALNLAQTWSAGQTFSGGIGVSLGQTTTLGGAVTMNTTGGVISIGTSQTTGTSTIGGTAQTGTLTFGQSTVTQLMNIQSGATSNGNTKTINFGINGAVGSNTIITIGPTLGAGNVIFSNNTIVTLANSLTVIGGITSTGYFNTTANISAGGAALIGGALSVNGNTLIAGNTLIGGNLIVNTSINSTSTTSGALQVTGGVGVQGTVYATTFRGNLGGGSTTTDTYITGNLIPTANVTYNLGSPTNKFKSAYFSGNTVYIGSESMGVDTNGTWLFTSNGATVSLGINATFNPASINASGGITSANISTGNLSATTLYALTSVTTGAVNSPFIGNTGTTLVGTLSTAAQPNITSVGILTGLNVSGNISSAVNNTNLLNSSGNVIANTVSAYALGGIITTASQTNITQVGTLTSLNVTGNVLASSLTGTLTTANQSAITQVGNLAGLNVSGNVTTNVLNAPLVYANTYVSAGAVYAPTIGNTGAVLTGTLSTSAQTNITSVGSLNTLNVLGNTTIGGNLFVVGTITTIGNVNNITITGNAGQFFGNVNGFGALYAGIGSGYTFEAQTTLQISSNYNGYAQLNMQNINHGPLASSDYIVTADNGTAGDTYVDLGMASSTYNYPGFTLIRPNDGYLIAYGNTTTGGGNLLLASSLNDIVFSVGGQGNISASSEFGRIQASSNAFIIKSTTTSTNTTSGALQVAGGVGIQGTVVAAQLNSTGNVLGAIGNFGSVNATGNVLATNFVGSGSLLTVLPGYAYSNVNVTAYTQTMGYTNYSNVNVTAYLAGSITTGAITATGLINTTGNVSAATLIAGQINTTGNVLATNYVGGGVNVSGNVSAATVIAGQINTTGNVLGVVGNFGSVNTTGNVSAATVIAGQINTTGNVLGLVGSFGSINSTGLINTTGNVSAATLIAGQINTTGNVLAVNFVGNGALLTALPGYAYSNVNVTAYTQTMGYTNYSNVNVAAYLAGSISTGAITASGAINTTANISAATVVAGQINTTGNILSNGAVLNTLTVNSNVSTNVASVASTVVVGAIGVTGNIIANASVVYGNPTGMNGVRQFYNPVTNSLDTVFG